MHHLYIPIHNNGPVLRKEREALVMWCRANGITKYAWIEDGLTGGRISGKDIRGLLSGVGEGDTVVAASLSRLGRSLPMLSAVMEILCDRGVSLVTLDGRRMIPGPEFSAYVENLREIVTIEKDIKVFRANDALRTRREEGLQLGRPPGAKQRPEKSVLYGKCEKLLALRATGLSTEKIARELGVSRGTIYNYLKANGLP